ncbi:non-canonical purine NTP diphosphatase [Cellulophaga sp. HaHaR_3_176]|uniref:non-canonical purine NTP diphosphatase n=1 Tax=Cellulophaga sp. HaHaR_3_176 TaxID=1942464 RepID=UPI001C1F22FE|nr:non-canonical purine NTP diphosphatase [Cellulophaga sp. HaHaR_3_176]QWX82603.1 non-canonical purine NTP diphosphatase [Cellulophaga sp. HaHaR_3_176]
MKLVFATHNQNKVKEVQLLMPKNITLLSLNDIDCFDEIAETANTLKGNAQLKADFVTEKYGYNCFADDTGLLVDSLNGEPGVFSARYAGEEKSTEANMAKLLKNLETKDNRVARFKTCIALNIDAKKYKFEGEVEGIITKEKYGIDGFGYDPIFRPNGFDKTFAELPIEIKNKISHRGRAIQKLIKHLNLS